MYNAGIFKPLSMVRKKEPWKAQMINDQTFLDYFYRLEEIAINMFEWKNLPDTVDPRFLELTLCEYGQAVYFDEPGLGNLALTVMNGGPLNLYRIPKVRRAYAWNGFYRELTENDSVLIYNNYLHQPSIMTILLYARRLYEIERTIDVNVKAQKTPVLITTDQEKLFSLKQAYAKMDGNVPVIFGTFNSGVENIKALNTQAPYVGDKLNLLKRQIWNEALTFFGVENSNTEKKERLVSDEVVSNLGGVQAQRYIMLNSRREAAEKINKMFNTNIEVNFRQELSIINYDMDTTTTTGPFTDGGESVGNLYD